jgi:hypothetical protein
MKMHMLIDKNLLIIKKNQSTQKRGNTKNKMKGPMSKKTNEPPKKANHKGNIKFPNLIWSRKNIK